MPQISFTGIDTTHCADADPSPVHPQPAGGILTGTAINNNLFFPQTAGTGYHWIYYDYTDNNGCNTSDSLLMRVDELPVVILSATHITCHGYDDGIAVANVSNGTFPYQYYWNTSNRDSVIRNLPPGNYSVTITDANGCTTTGNITVTEPMKITLDIIAAPDSVMLGDTVQFFISHNAGTIQSYVWQPADWLSCTSCPQPFSVPQETITYTLTITDTNTCTASDTAFIFIKPKKAFYIPNIFSPNNDGINDILYVYIKGTKRFTFRIYNRWGEKVFETTDPLIGWTGNYKNKEAEPGVYVYDLHAIYWDNEPIKKKGSITLVR
jgi:gliding motility-associated-like protein